MALNPIAAAGYTTRTCASGSAMSTVHGFRDDQFVERPQDDNRPRSKNNSA